MFQGGRGVSGFIGRRAHNPDRHHHHRKGSSRPGNIAATTIRYYLQLAAIDSYCDVNSNNRVQRLMVLLDAFGRHFMPIFWIRDIRAMVPMCFRPLRGGGSESQIGTSSLGLDVNTRCGDVF